MSNKQQWTFFDASSDKALAQQLPDFDSAFQAFDKSTATWITGDKETAVYRLQAGNKTYYLKQYHRLKGFGPLIGFSRPEQELRNLQRFAAYGLHTCRVAVFGLERKNFRASRAVLISEAIANTLNLQETAEQNPLFKSNRHWRLQVIREVANILRSLHQRRFCHNDIQWRNLLLTQDENRAHISLIDCPFGRTYIWPMLPYRRIKDLACLDEQARQHLSRSDRLRFYKQYKQIDKLSAKHKQEILTMLARYGD